MSAGAAVALRAVGLDLRYGNAHALRGLTLEVPAGLRVAVVGRSGSGKTGLARLLAGVVPPDGTASGRLEFPGGTVELAGPMPGGRRRHVPVGWLPQEAHAALNPYLRLGSHLAETLRAAGRPAGAPDLAALSASVGLDAALLRRYPHQVSGGQAQRVALAAALARAPTVLVADEPTSALDPGNAALVLDLLGRAVARSGMSLVLVTHNLAVAASCDQVLVLDAGAVVEAGPPGVILSRPVSAAAASLVAAHRRLETRGDACSRHRA